MGNGTDPLGGRVVWCLGMYASASTWVFNIVRGILAVDARPVSSCFISNNGTHLQPQDPRQVLLVKSHEIDDAALVAEVAGRSARLIVSVRDPRDAVVSLMVAHTFPFERALRLVEKSALLCRAFAADERTAFLKYESEFFNTPDTVAALAAHLGCALEASAAERIFSGLTRPEVEKHIARMPQMRGMLKSIESGDLLDPVSHWHSHHAGRTGKTMKWREVLTDSQVQEIERRLGPPPAFQGDL